MRRLCNCLVHTYHTQIPVNNPSTAFDALESQLAYRSVFHLTHARETLKPYNPGDVVGAGDADGTLTPCSKVWEGSRWGATDHGHKVPRWAQSHPEHPLADV